MNGCRRYGWLDGYVKKGGGRMDTLSTGGWMDALRRGGWMDALSRGGWMDGLVKGGEWIRYVAVVG